VVIDRAGKEFVQERIRVDALSKMNHLELLILRNVNCFGTLNCFCNELRYLYWSNFPWMSLPPTFHPDQLVELNLPHSNIKQLWEGKKVVYYIFFVFIFCLEQTEKCCVIISELSFARFNFVSN